LFHSAFKEPAARAELRAPAACRLHARVRVLLRDPDGWGSGQELGPDPGKAAQQGECYQSSHRLDGGESQHQRTGRALHHNTKQPPARRMRGLGTRSR